MRYLLDTSGYIELHRNRVGEDATPLAEASVILVSVVSVGELLAGFRRADLRRREKEFRKFLEQDRVVVAEVTADTAEYFAELHDYLRGRGTPVPTNDVWIAATAMQHGARILTTDRHFLAMPQLLVEMFPRQSPK